MSLDDRVDIGHVHLKVADLDRALGFWRDVLGFEEQARMGDQAAFISAGGYHHHIGLNTWESAGRLAACRRDDRPLPRRRPLPGPQDARGSGATRSRRRRSRSRAPPTTVSSEAIYLRDPDGNGVELYRDRPRDEWPRAVGRREPRDVHAPLDLRALLAEAE